MAWSLIASASARGSGLFQKATTSAVDTSGADLLLLAVSVANSVSAVATPTDNKGNTWIPLTEGTNQSTSLRIFYCNPTSVGSNHTFRTENGFLDAISMEAWSGAHASSPFDVENGGTSTADISTLATGSVTPSQNNSLIFTGFTFQRTTGSNASSIDSSFTLQTSVAGSSSVQCSAAAHLDQGTASAVNPTWTHTNSGSTNDGVIARIAVFKPAASGVSADPAAGVLALAGTVPPLHYQINMPDEL